MTERPTPGAKLGCVLGTGNDQDTGAPTEVILPEGVRFVQVEAGNEYSLAIAEDGDTYHWGYTKRVPGRSDGSEYVLPEKVLTPPGVTHTQASAGAGYTVGTDASGTVNSWGDTTCTAI
ncbi:hypothetical protein V5R04_00450 [Jonesiaceae bacterium BS-20]|uniref:Uncharacterized protein n=1 Tax=Jonesiaceae bacterium BS-20 TaxID=3120821 RepID=A0AAU7DWR8_9MICO